MADPYYDPFNPSVPAPSLNLLPNLLTVRPQGMQLHALPGFYVRGVDPAVATPASAPPSITSRPAPGTPFSWDWLRALLQPAVPAAQAAAGPPGPGYHAGTGAGPYAPPPAPAGPLLTPLATDMPLPSQAAARPNLAQQAAAYRQAQQPSLTADQLNAQSLAAANAGRTYFNPQLAAGYGAALPPGAYGPPSNVTNALMAPPQANLQGPAYAAPPPPALATGLPAMRRPAPGQSTPAQYTMLNMQGLY